MARKYGRKKMKDKENQVFDGYGNNDFLSFLLYNTIVNLNKEK